MKFRVLGPLTASVVLPSAAQPRRLLAVLLARPGEFVHRDTLVDELWPEGAPSSAAAIVQVSVSKLRKALSPGVQPGCEGQRLRSGPQGYRLTVAPGELDAEDFVMLAASAAADPGHRRDLLERALDCWHGSALADVAGGPLVEAHKLWLEDRRRSVLGQLVELDLGESRFRAVAERLGPVVAQRPTDERLVARLAVALAGLEHRDSALELLRRTRRELWDQAGVRPGAELLEVYRGIAGCEWISAGPPAQLPPPVPDFTGRSEALAELGRALRCSRPILLHGPAGAGKTTLAVQAAWRVRKRFPDGQLVAGLRRADGVQADIIEVLAGFVRALGVAASDVPGGLADLVALWRSHTADRRVLVLIEDPQSEQQVRALLPAGPGCVTVITSRRRLPGLDGVQPIEAGELTESDAYALLGATAGTDRLAAEPESARALVARCGGLALAVRIAGSKLAQRPHLKVAELVARLEDERRGLDELTAGETGVRAVVASALRERSGPERDVLRTFAAFGGRDLSEWCAAALLDLPMAEAREVLDTLADGHLLRVTGRDAGGFVRYTLPGFVRLLVRERARPEENRIDRAAVHRALSVTLAVAEHVLSLVGTEFVRTDGSAEPTPDAAVLARIAADPIAWRDAEAEGLAAAVRTASAHGWHGLTERLSDAYIALTGTRLAGTSAQAVSLLGLQAARRRSDLPAEAAKLLNLGTLHWEHGRSGRARHYFTMAKARFRALDDLRGTGAALVALADVDAEAGDAPLALEGLREALTLLRECGDLPGQAVASAHLGSLSDDLGDVRRAMESFEASMLLAQRCEDGRRHDQAAKRYADVLRRHGRPDAAADLLTGALRGAIRVHERHWEAHVLRSLGDLHAEAGEIADGERCLNHSLELFTELGHRHAAAYTHRSLAEARRLAGDPAAAEEHLRVAMRTFRELHDRRGAGYALLTLGRLRAGTGAGQAEKVLRTAAELFRELGFPLWEVRALHELSGVSSASPERERVREALTKIRIGPLPV
ncbi:AfsR/SARP family transcriptional regulator [Amycolatopsis sp. H20-H5]|uniref:AfsR/SARP family transcriptional regulator n=1 Tax=Amycolatopsis sp. H20-H5 TaxID=3046309 RepID=UPI002DBA2C13|nr:BTAD domain-containing putative transcriptional regulator [Amycolatopsis sp. H20-H5]MEC3976726.1 BTAD domain-containing putative transcriptional regulator [Amycolatopsis sp. H20-H5]